MQVWCMRCFIGMTYFWIVRESCIHRKQRRLQHFSNFNVHKNQVEHLITTQSPRQTQSEGLGQGLRFCLGASSPRMLQLRISGPRLEWNRTAYEIQSSPGVNRGKCERGSHLLWGRGLGEDARCHDLAGLVELSATPGLPWQQGQINPCTSLLIKSPVCLSQVRGTRITELHGTGPGLWGTPVLHLDPSASLAEIQVSVCGTDYENILELWENTLETQGQKREALSRQCRLRKTDARGQWEVTTGLLGGHSHTHISELHFGRYEIPLNSFFNTNHVLKTQISLGWTSVRLSFPFTVL